MPENSDLDNYTSYGKYLVYGTSASTIANAPFGTAFRFIVLRFDKWVIQIAWNVGSNSVPAAMFYRRFDEGSTNYKWTRADNFNCNTPADLASLLGVSSVILGNGAQKLKDGDDCNDCNAQGVWIKHKDGASLVVNNSPWSNTGFVLWYISPYQDNNSLTRFGLQVAFSYQGIKARRHNGEGSWTEWANIFS